ncbi:conjugal exonuclease V alpha subunit TraA (plasmid) [Acetobacter pasteurianus IFO 3283-22]|uniref:Conjugal exonuclease V alpha subunit TraA n=1 Tax=Acetobacter pasteurianus (strain NBRC 105184 / IFO 3283-01) TaxID=634452 RepID=C7JI86_ACEP3|nr:conjugal exonuclease V alpha subunit TraA [Acetobacter pasteurianus IFO 3283-01]BAI03861.1 conjugal exonuclease V alpha subunit TraA [Acetobacter pasteurianus IFO 3283-03]BAI06908.1 conjugal exonuclease V alpha subunit TraA [Acetobacter pasteurianus IFO 3283-07]BAI09956.1 conjugal exonuclease V alpha subunit TraA [Acetobacter pasteurianus IFO 3283-22]BAI13004.1 conjugal exonuclease V alpha subunit TraA [Acetobacter pasteurianus IFO 3283-26]BAI16050.1 conjugal exonuclease V alpha subunit Tra
MHEEFYRGFSSLALLAKEDLPTCVREAIVFLEKHICRVIPDCPHPILRSSLVLTLSFPREQWVHLIEVIKWYRRRATPSERRLISRFLKIVRPILPEATPEPFHWIPPASLINCSSNKKKQSVAS